MVGTKLDTGLDAVPELNPVTEPVPDGTITLHPRDHAKAISRELLATPTETLGRLMGEAPGP
jgi:hypothetical protein